MSGIMAMLPTLLLGALALVMFGVGLSLRVADFTRLREQPRAVAIALGLQVVALPLACWGLVEAFGLPPPLAVGMMLLAASPGGVSANLFSHLFGGDVALNISLTAANTLLAIVTLPLVANLALMHFMDGEAAVGLQTRKLAEVIAVVLVPVLLGMALAKRAPALAARLEKPFKLLSALVLAAFTLAALASEWRLLLDSLGELGAIVLLFNLASLLSGYFVSRWLGLRERMAIAVSYEIGIHNGTLALYIALSVLGSMAMALPAAMYSVSMYLVGTAFGLWLRRRQRAADAAGA